jgi:hypothetical protein
MARAALTNLDTSAIASKNLSRLLLRLDQKLDSGVTTTRIERARIAAVSMPELLRQWPLPHADAPTRIWNMRDGFYTLSKQTAPTSRCLRGARKA